MRRAIWKGDISFGLVYIPVALYPAQTHEGDVKFRLLDKRDLSPIGYQKINKNTGEKVTFNEIVEGFEYESDQYVLFTKEELKSIEEKSNQSIEILEFVEEGAISPEFFERPYYLEPIKKSKKAYILLREALRNSGKIGITKIIIKTREYLAALLVEKDLLVLELLRYQYQLKPAENSELHSSIKEIKKNEIKMAESLIESMTTQWNPDKYADDYQAALLKLVAKKVKKAESYILPHGKHEKPHYAKDKQNVIDMMQLLKKSLEKKKTQSQGKIKRRTGRGSL